MVETTNKVILKIDFEGSNAIQQTVALKKGLSELRDEQAKLTDAVKAGNVTEEKAAVQMEILNVQIKENQRETRTVTKFIDDSVKARKAETGSIEANRAKLSQLTAEYIKTGKPTQQQTAQIKTLSDTLKKQEEALGDNRRSVGDYAKGLAGLKGPIGSAVNGISAFNTTMRANPIGAVVTVLQFLFDALNKNAGIADKISFIFAGVNKAFRFVIDTVKNVVSSFDNLGKALTNPIGFLFDLGKGIVEAGKAGFEAAKQMDDFTESQARLNAEIKQNDIQIRSLTFQLKDKTKTEKERIALAEQIAELEVANADKQLEKSSQLLAAKKLELKGLELSGEQKAELLELESAVVEAESEKQIAQSQKQTRINILLEKEENSALKEEKQARVDMEKDFNEKIKKIQSDFKNEIAEVEKDNKKLEKEKDKAEVDRLTAQINAELDLRKQQVQVRGELADSEIELEKAKFDAIQGLIDLSQAAAGENASLQAVLFGLEKAVAIAEIIVNLQRERSLNAVAGAELNAILPGSGTVFTTTQNTIAAIRAGLGISAIVAQAIPQIKKGFAEGGYTGDGSPTDQSTNLGVKPYTYHKREYVVPDKVLSTPQGAYHANILESMRKSMPSPLAYLGGYADGGFTQRALASGVNQQLQASELTNAFKNLPTPVVRVTEINRVQSNRENSISVSEL